jgi:hypothetical protein
MLGPQREDVSRFPPDVVRRFLADLHVPLVVWNLSGPGAMAPASWRPDGAFGGFEDLAAASGRLRTLLDRQRIVWLAGHHLPQLLGLGPAVSGIEIAR